MERKFKIILIAIAFLSCGMSSGQDEFIALSSAQFLRGLDNPDYLHDILTQNGFELIKKWKVQGLKGGIYEYWQYESLVFVDMIRRRGQQGDIIVRVDKEVKELPDRLIQTFPYKRIEMIDDDLSKVNLRQLGKDKRYSLKYTQEGKNVGVFVWYDEPYYYFEYTTGQ
jgi:hypothetical protein